jgi:1-acyl-sn-glycerol-3-phosphate acyltransferase
VANSQLSARARRGLAIQRAIAFALAPLSTLAVLVLLRGWLRLRLENASGARRTYRSLLSESDAPLLICANHLTLIDSALIGWALGTPAFYLRHFSALPWNVPEQKNFASTRLRRALAYVYKCVPVVRGGDRAGIADTLARFAHLLRSGEVGLIFPEGGRSRSGRVETDRAAYGVGRIVKDVPHCRVLCCYLRGDRQQSWGSLPARGDRLRISLALFEPKAEGSGLRASRDIARQITTRLAEMEAVHFAVRGGGEPS